VASGAEIAKGLMTHGMAVSMPCAVVENGTRSEQRTFVTTLQHLEGIIQKERIQSPALIVVGPVCTLAEKFDWFSKLPLKGARLLVTRPKEKEGTLVGRLRELGAHVTSLPAIATKPVPFPIPDLSQYGVLVFTSGAGVNSFFQALWREGLDARKMAGLKIAVVGKETEKQLATYGLRADFVPTVFCAETLAGEMLESGFLEKGIRVLLIQAKIASEEVFQRLSARGIQTDRLTVYETQYVQQEGIDPGEYDFGIFTSASSVEGYARALGEKAEVEALAAVCIGEKTAAAARELGMPVYVAKEATIQSLIETVWEQYRDKKKENEG
ncbi:MAG: uroporphyrinogen-III synthase, partial [Clostridia bacterium]